MTDAERQWCAIQHRLCFERSINTIQGHCLRNVMELNVNAATTDQSDRCHGLEEGSIEILRLCFKQLRWPVNSWQWPLFAGLWCQTIGYLSVIFGLWQLGTWWSEGTLKASNFRQKMHQIQCRLGLRHRACLDPLLDLRDLLLRGGEGRGGERSEWREGRWSLYFFSVDLHPCSSW